MIENEKDFIVPRGWLFESKQDFAKQFNINMQDDGFYNRCMTIISQMIKKDEKFYALLSGVHLIMGIEFIETYSVGFIDLSTQNYAKSYTI